MERAGVKDANDLHCKLLKEPGGFESEWEALTLQARAVELPRVGIILSGLDGVTARRLNGCGGIGSHSGTLHCWPAYPEPENLP